MCIWEGKLAAVCTRTCTGQRKARMRRIGEGTGKRCWKSCLHSEAKQRNTQGCESRLFGEGATKSNTWEGKWRRCASTWAKMRAWPLATSSVAKWRDESMLLGIVHNRRTKRPVKHVGCMAVVVVVVVRLRDVSPCFTITWVGQPGPLIRLSIEFCCASEKQ